MGIRSIEFRGKRVDNGEWIYGVPFFQENQCYMIEDLFICDEYQCTGATNTEVIPETVGQYTGICDKNGNGTKIYEEDIVTGLFDFGVGINAVIAFSNGAFGLLANQHEVEHFHPFTSLCNIEYEVIGNIYDNPELLKGVRK